MRDFSTKIERPLWSHPPVISLIFSEGGTPRKFFRSWEIPPKSVFYRGGRFIPQEGFLPLFRGKNFPFLGFNGIFYWPVFISNSKAIPRSLKDFPPSYSCRRLELYISFGISRKLRLLLWGWYFGYSEDYIFQIGND